MKNKILGLVLVTALLSAPVANAGKLETAGNVLKSATVYTLDKLVTAGAVVLLGGYVYHKICKNQAAKADVNKAGQAEADKGNKSN